MINLEYYSDLVAILGRLLTDEQVGGRERLLVARAVLAVLAGSGDALNVDPAMFHAYLYAHALDAHTGNFCFVYLFDNLWRIAGVSEIGLSYSLLCMVQRYDMRIDAFGKCWRHMLRITRTARGTNASVLEAQHIQCTMSVCNLHATCDTLLEPCST